MGMIYENETIIVTGGVRTTHTRWPTSTRTAQSGNT